jgi:predicted secreted protein
MATTGIMNGTLLLLYVEGTVIAKTTSHSLSVNHSLRETTNKDSAGWKDNLEGLRDWSIDCDALHAEDNAFGLEDLLDFVLTRTQVTLKFSTEVSGDVKYSGEAWITSVSENAGVEDNVSYSVSFEGTGALSKGTVT